MTSRYWRTLAACRFVDPELMFPDPGNRKAVHDAVAVCTACPVRQECLDEVLAEEGSRTKAYRHGVRGGMSTGQRYAAYRASRPTSEGGKRPRTGGKPLAPCGTSGAYDRHVRRGEPVDDACREAHNAERREARSRDRAKQQTAA